MPSSSTEERENVKGEVHELRVAAMDLMGWSRRMQTILDRCENEGATPRLVAEYAETARNVRQIGEQLEGGVQTVACVPTPACAVKRAERAGRNASAPEPLRSLINTLGGAPMFRDHKTTSKPEAA